MAGWIALSDHEADPAGTGPLLAQAMLALEIALPLPGPSLILDHRESRGWERSLSIFADPEGGLVIRHRQGPGQALHSLRARLAGAGAAQLLFNWNGPARRWQMRLRLPQNDGLLRSEGVNPLPLPTDDLRALCRGAARHPALLWIGATEGRQLPAAPDWIGPQTPIPTERGTRAAIDLRAGDMVICEDGPRPLRALRVGRMPARGSFAPVLLRAPYFGRNADLLVAASQHIGFSGPAVGYAFSEEEAIARAGDIVDSRRALFDQRRSATTCVAMDLGAPAVVRADGCALAIRGSDGTLPGLRKLEAYECAPLIGGMGRGSRRNAA